MSGIFGSLFGGGKRKASQPADASGRAAATSSRTGPGPSSWTGPPPRDPKEWRGPHNPTRSSRGTKTDADADASGPPRSVVDLTRDEAPPSSSPRAARAAAREPPREPPRPSDGRREHRRRRSSKRPSPRRSRPGGVPARNRAGSAGHGHRRGRGRRRGERLPLRRPAPALVRRVRRPHPRGPRR